MLKFIRSLFINFEIKDIDAELASCSMTQRS